MSFIRDLYFVYRDVKARKYAAAKNSHTHNIPAQSNGTVNDEIEASWEEVTNRTLALVRDFPIFAGAVSAMEAYTTADGIKPQISVTKRGSTEIDVNLSQEIEARFMDWANNPLKCDTGGRLTFWEMQALDDRMQGEFGESIFVDTINRDGFTITPVEPLNLDDAGFKMYIKTENNNVLWRGIEYNPKTSRVVNYHFTDPQDANNFGYSKNTIKVPKSRVLHNFKSVRSGQMRGITPFAPAILSAYQLRDFMGAELSSQLMASKWLAWVTAPVNNVWSDQANRDNVEYDNSYSKYTKTMDNATIEYLKNGETVTLNTQTRAAHSFKNFNEIVIRYVSVTCQVPYEILSGDYSGLNFTTLRAVRNDFKQQLRPRWQRKINQFCQPVFEKWLEYEVLNNGLNIRDYFSNKKKYTQAVRWITPKLEEIDPLKEFNAELLKTRAGMKSPQSIIKGMGEDPEKVMEEIKQWRDLSKANDLVFPELSSSQPLINNYELMAMEEAPAVKKEDEEDE